MGALITSWRQAWGEGDFPFLVVQLANYAASKDPNDPGWPGVREAQCSSPVRCQMLASPSPSTSA